jgi:hypothetical protein
MALTLAKRRIADRCAGSSRAGDRYLDEREGVGASILDTPLIPIAPGQTGFVSQAREIITRDSTVAGTGTGEAGGPAREELALADILNSPVSKLSYNVRVLQLTLHAGHQRNTFPFGGAPGPQHARP